MANSRALNISFEFFPPKSPEGYQNLKGVASRLADHAPDFFSVTFGAGGSTRDGTLDTVKILQEATAIPVAPHLACVGSSRQALVEILKSYQALGIKRLVALRGDLPAGMGQDGELRFAHDLVALVREVTGNHFHIEVAAYPECHPQAKNMHADILNLKHKYEAGANSAITQYFFSADSYFYFLDECAKQKIFMPIVPGIMPIANFPKLVRFSQVCGAEIPQWLRKRLEAYGDDKESIKAFGFEVVHDLCQRLIKGGAPGLHFYTLNHTELSIKLLINLDLAPQKSHAQWLFAGL